MSRAWFIDTLDPRGGLAFASWREATLMNGAELEDAPVFHIAPPFFAPQPVASRAIALAAERHGFQLGYFDGGEELPFETLEDVVDLVRSFYSKAARDDLPPVPPTEGEPLGFDPEGGTEADFEQALMTDALAFMVLSRETPRGKTTMAPWATRDGGKPVDPPVRGGMPLVQGATLVFAELARRYPGDHSSQFEEWRRSAARFVGVLRRLGLIGVLAHPEIAHPLLKACERLIGSEPSRNYPGYLDPRVIDALTFMSHGRSPYLGHFYFEATLGHPAVGETTTPLDDLAHLPISSKLGAAIGAQVPKMASVANLLAAVMGGPAPMAKNPQVAALALFASARMVAYDGAPYANYSPTDQLGSPDLGVRQHRLHGLAGRAFQWLGENLPRKVFPPSIEAAIENAPHPARAARAVLVGA